MAYLDSHVATSSVMRAKHNHGSIGISGRAAGARTVVVVTASTRSAPSPAASHPALPLRARVASAAAPAGRFRSARGVGLVLAGALSVHSGSAVAATLFPRAGVGVVVALRLTVGAILLLAICRPAIRGRSRSDWALIAAFGAALAGMNSVFYQAIDRIPLGTAVTLEVLGPLTLSVVAARRASAWLWAGLALAGVALLGRGGFDRLDPLGVTLALIAGALWAAYIVLSSRTGSRFPKADGLALALGVAAVLTLPLGAAGAAPALADPVVLGLGAAVAVLSSVLPYTLEMFALRQLHTSTFAVLMSLGPALAAGAGLIILGQAMSWPEVLAMGLVIAASIGAVRSGGARPA
jgi:inner membrane transporter RhtA